MDLRATGQAMFNPAIRLLRENRMFASATLHLQEDGFPYRRIPDPPSWQLLGCLFILALLLYSLQTSVMALCYKLRHLESYLYVCNQSVS